MARVCPHRSGDGRGHGKHDVENWVAEGKRYECGYVCCRQRRRRLKTLSQISHVYHPGCGRLVIGLSVLFWRQRRRRGTSRQLEILELWSPNETTRTFGSSSIVWSIDQFCEDEVWSYRYRWRRTWQGVQLSCSASVFSQWKIMKCSCRSVGRGSFSFRTVIKINATGWRKNGIWAPRSPGLRAPPDGVNCQDDGLRQC